MKASGVTERETHTHEVTERERTTFYYFNPLESKFFFFFCLALSYNAHLSIDVHCSNEAKKIDLAPLLKHDFGG